MRILRLVATAAVLLAAWGLVSLDAQQAGNDGDIQVIPVKGNIWMLSVGGSNATVSIGRDGILLVDTGSASLSDKFLAAVRRLDRQVTAPRMPQQSCVGIVEGCAWWSSSTFMPTTVAPPAPKPIVGIINTSFDPDHMGGNAVMAAAGRSHVGVAPQEAWIITHENANPLLRAETAGKPVVELPSDALPTETYASDSFKLNYFNGEGVVLWHMPKAHTDGDTVVQFRGSDVLVAGDIFNLAGYPVIEIDKGGSVQGVIDGLNRLLDMAVVDHMMEGGTMIVPGHGRLADSADLAYYRDMVTIVRDRVRAAAKKGMSVAQIKEAKLTRDYDGRFARNPAYTADMFVEAVYRTLDTRP